MNKPAIVGSSFFPDAATWRTHRNIRDVLPIRSIVLKHVVVHKTISTVYCCQMRTEPRLQVTSTDNPVLTSVLRYASRQTDRQTDTLMTILRTQAIIELVAVMFMMN